MSNPHGTEIERIARALWRERWIEPEPEILPPEQLGPAASDWEACKEVYFRDAIALLKALSEPSEGMIEAGKMKILLDHYAHVDVRTKSAFTAMINHILKEAGE